MRYSSIFVTLAIAAEVQGFLAPTCPVRNGAGNSFDTKIPLIVRRSMAAVEQSNTWSDAQDFNMDLDKLAEKCGIFDENVISRAAECQDQWEAQVIDKSSAIRPDTISFNIVLKAWSRCCQVLADRSRSRNFNNLPVDITHSVPVYTARDAAERATTLLLGQEDDTTARPDTTSYNIVIGKCTSDIFVANCEESVNFLNFLFFLI